MATTYWTLWTREPARLQEHFHDARFIRFDQVQPGVEVFVLTSDDPLRVRAIRRAATQLVALGILLSFARAEIGPDSQVCAHQPDPMSHHWRMDEWVVTDDQHHRLVNYFKADRCDVIWKYDDVDVLTFADEQAVRAEVQRRIARYSAQDILDLT